MSRVGCLPGRQAPRTDEKPSLSSARSSHRKVKARSPSFLSDTLPFLTLSIALPRQHASNTSGATSSPSVATCPLMTLPPRRLSQIENHTVGNFGSATTAAIKAVLADRLQRAQPLHDPPRSYKCESRVNQTSIPLRSEGSTRLRTNAVDYSRLLLTLGP
jgi:hypothetical protein